MDFGFRDTAVVVTGASSGIGRETARAFAAAGARVALVARRRGALEELRDEIKAAGGEAVVIPADVTRRTAVRRALVAARDELGAIDVVVNNAGILIPARVTEIAAADLRAMLQVNLFGALFVMQEAVSLMEQQEGGGTIVNVASLAGRRGVSPLGGYCATKFALVGVTEALRLEIDSDKIHVALVMPGVIETPMAEVFHGDADASGLWPAALNMPVSWVVWAIFAAARFRLVEVSVPPGAATFEKLASLLPGAADSAIRWGTSAAEWLGDLLGAARTPR